MKISEIPYKKVREAAERNREIDDDALNRAFSWKHSPEGVPFWAAVDDGEWDEARKLRPDLFDESNDDLIERFMLAALPVLIPKYDSAATVANATYNIAKACVERLKRGENNV